MTEPAKDTHEYSTKSDFRVRDIGIETGLGGPPSYGPAKKITINTGETELPEVKEFKVPKFRFIDGHTQLRAAKAVSIRIHQGEELWFAENDRLNVYATGESPEHAIKEFSLLLLHLYRYFKGLQPSKRMAHARKLKQIFADAFCEVP